MERTDAPREEALKILIKVFEGKSYSNILIKNLGQSFSSLDRAFITEMVYGTIKWKLRLDNIIDNLSNIKSDKISAGILNILRLGIYQIDFMDKVPQSAAVNECVKLAKKYGNPGAARYVNAILRNYIRKHDSIVYPDRGKSIGRYLSVYYSFPLWMVERLIKDFGSSFTEEFLKSGNQVPDLTARVNNLKTDKESLKNMLLEKNIEVQDGIYVDDALILKGVPGIEYIEEYKKGYFTIQDQSSMLAAKILSPQAGDFIMDVCSAPGTKSTYMAEIMRNRGTIMSGDISSSKLKLVSQNAKRLGIDIIKTYCGDARMCLDEYIEKADKVLIDAPCTGLGIMRKKPEIRWNRDIRDIDAIKSLQESILKTSSRYVKPGGVLVYSTCTVVKEENVEMIQKFVRENLNFRPEDISNLVPSRLKKESLKNGYIELYPNVDNVDGFFIARLRRVE